MNEPHRIRTAFLSSLRLFQEPTVDAPNRPIELALADLDKTRREEITFEIAERLQDAGILERVDRFQRDGQAFVRYRERGSGETFLLPAASGKRVEEGELVRASRPHWHVRSRLLYRVISHLIAVERKLFARDERNAEYLQTDPADILRTILSSAMQILECDDTRLYSLARGLDTRYAQPVSEGEPWNRALAENWVGRRAGPVSIEDLARPGHVRAMIGAESMDATMHVAVAPYGPKDAPESFRSLAMARVGEPGTPVLYVLEAWSRTPDFFSDERLGLLNVIAEHATDLPVTLKKLGIVVMMDGLTGVFNRPYLGRQRDRRV